MMLAILFSLKKMESLQNRVATHFQTTSLFSMRTVSIVLSQSSGSVNADAWCKRALAVKNKSCELFFDTDNRST